MADKCNDVSSLFQKQEVATLAYAAPRPGREAARPKTLLLIVAGHVLVISAVMLAKSGIPQRLVEPPLIIKAIPLPKDPPPLPDPQPTRIDPAPSQPTIVDPVIKFDPARTDDGTIVPIPTGPINGNGTTLDPMPPIPLPPVHDIVRRAPRMATSEAMLRPPYPDSKRMLGEEAALKLRLTIDERGRVTAVDPVGPADPAFLDSARRHLIRAWRFAPATEDGRPVASTTVITLRFELGEG